MAKTKTPFLSVGAHGSVGESITAQKRSAFTLVREKPFPTDPYSLPQAYQRWLYEDYAYLWTQQSEATRRAYAADGVRFHLTGFQYWMKVRLTLLPDIAGWWKLDEKSGAVAHDSSRNNNHGTLFGVAPIVGLINGGMSFDGLNDLISIPDNPSLACSEGLTILTSFRLADIASDHVILDKGIWVAHGYGIFWHQVISRLRLQVGDGVNWKALDLVLTDPLDWHSIALTATPNSLLAGYIDGLFVSSTPLTFAIGHSPLDLYFGRQATAADKWNKGYQDNTIIFNRVLDATEILRHSLRRYPPGAPGAPLVPVAIDVGPPAIVRPFGFGANVYTVIAKDNPANATGPITTAKIYPKSNMTGVRIGSFYTTNGNILKCRDSEAVGNLAGPQLHTLPVTINFQLGDYIGYYALLNDLYRSTEGFDGIWFVSGEFIDPGDESAYTFAAGDAISLYGEG